MITVTRSDIELIETPGGNYGAGIATPRRGAVEISVIRQRQMPGGANPVHSHDREETIVVLTGTISITTSGETADLRVGDAAIISPGESHQVVNCGDVPAEWLLVAPAGIRFLLENGDLGSPPWAE